MVLPEDSFMIMVKRGCSKMRDLRHILRITQGLRGGFVFIKTHPSMMLYVARAVDGLRGMPFTRRFRMHPTKL